MKILMRSKPPKGWRYVQIVSQYVNKNLPKKFRPTVWINGIGERVDVSDAILIPRMKVPNWTPFEGGFDMYLPKPKDNQP